MKFYNDCLEQTHILIAGATGSGKSVLINGIIATAIQKPASEVQFILIDPKRVELVEYKNLPHTVAYASEPNDMAMALEYAIAITDTRYHEMQKARIKDWNGSHIYVIIDELADLMTTDKNRVMPLIQRLCQIGRASGISVIAATQCPLVSVIPTPIKVNFDTRIGLHTVTAQHSRNIIEFNGCEKLPRYGKAYYCTPDKVSIVQVPMIDSAERSRLINQWTNTEDDAEHNEKREEPKPEPKQEQKPVSNPKGMFGWMFA